MNRPPAPSPALTAAITGALDGDRSTIIDRWYEQQFGGALDHFGNPYASRADAEHVRRSHLDPLLSLLAEYARTRDPLYLDLYRDERRRYAPHRDGTGVLTEFFSLVIPAHEAAILERVGPLRDEAARWLAAVHGPLVKPRAGVPVRILTVGDCLLSEVQSFLHPLGAERGLELDFRYYYFSAAQGADVVRDGIASALADGRTDVVAASYLSYEGIPLYRSLLKSADSATAAERAILIGGMIGFMGAHLRQIRELTEAPILLHNASGLPLGRWRRRIPFLPAMSRGRRRALAELNAAVALLADSVENCILIDETAVTQEHGLRACGEQILPRRIAGQAEIHPAWFGRHLAVRYADLVHRIATLRRTKVLLVDFDNTLWNGVMADGPVEHHAERQLLLKRLKEQGIVLAAVSKNDPANIRWDEMHLAPDDFAALRINWNRKAQSIRELAAELNVGLDAFVLIDDNPVERELVRLEVPQVHLLDGNDGADWKALELLFHMPNTRRTEEARHRTEMYREQTRRTEATSGGADYPTLMAKLELRARIRPAERNDLERLTELVQRTNQFNTTTIRYTRGELERLIRSEDHLVLVGHLADKFGDLGMVAVAVMRRSEAVATIESFVMSCRAMGFGMEQALLAHAIANSDAARVAGRFVPSGRNDPASALFPGAGFAEEDPGLWVLPHASEGPAVPAWINVS